MSRIFVSYATVYRPVVEERILPVVHDAGFDLWIDHGDIVGGDAFLERIIEGLKECDLFLIALTPAAAESEYVKDELHWAMLHRGGRVIPVMLADCDPYDFHMRLPRLQHIDFRQSGDEGAAGLRRVLRCARESDPKDSQVVLEQAQAPGSEKMELIGIVLTLLPREEQKHLRNLRGASEVHYKGRRSLRHELRHLTQIGALERKPGRRIGELQEGVELNLAEIVGLTRIGEVLAQHVR